MSSTKTNLRERLIRRIHAREVYALRHLNPEAFRAGYTSVEVHPRTVEYITDREMPNHQLSVYTFWQQTTPGSWLAVFHYICWIDIYGDLYYLTKQIPGRFPFLH
jgi:hypothetical protein